MAVTKTITSCTPYINSSNKVDKWDITMKYENDNKGDSTYYTSDFSKTISQLDDDGNELILPNLIHLPIHNVSYSFLVFLINSIFFKFKYFCN